ncbi:MAG: hypothetical protein LBI05_09550 [Planctomycetaceae bacterium]|jgi:hypothetical protein|nr:hypothetical protein [Planctomycetaceae bacterium]
MTINPRELQKRIELDGAESTVHHLTESLKQGDLKPDDFSIRNLAESFMSGGLSQIEQMETLLEESAISLVNVVGAVIDTKIKEAYHQEIFAASKLVRTIPTRLDGEKIHTFGAVADNDLTVTAGEPYTSAEIHAGYIETPNTAKRGLIIPVTKEAVFFDQTHHILERAAEVGEILALNKEQRILDMILGISKTYKQNGTLHNTYYSGSASHPWKNQLAGNELLNWQSIEAAEDVFGEMIDPISETPILIEPNAVLVMPPKRHLAHRLFYASSISYEESSTTAAIRNPFAKYRLVSSRLAYQQLKAQSGVQNPDKWWFIGNFRKAFAYMENWGITVAKSLPGSESDFTHDVVVRFKASERGTPAVLDPRYVVKCTA